MGNTDKYKEEMDIFLKTIDIMSVEEVFSRIIQAVKTRKKLSLVRIGDGEALTLAQQKVMSLDEVVKYSFLRYAGVRVPDMVGRDKLVKSVKKADIVGIPLNLLPNFLPLTLRVFDAYLIDPYSMNLTNACINYFLYQSGGLKKVLLEGSPRVLVIGNKARDFGSVLRKEGVAVSGIIPYVYGLKDVNRVLMLSERYTFDIAVVAAGVAAVVLCERIARLQNKVALDIGHVADNIIEKGCF